VAQNLSRRKYGRLSKYLTDVMTDPAMSMRTRMTAALRLDDLLARADARADRAKEQEFRRELARLKIHGDAGTEQAQATIAALEVERASAKKKEHDDVDQIAALYLEAITEAETRSTN
jgi:hypothetical protein